MVDLQELIDLPGAGKAHSVLCRSGHPTEFPHSVELIDYRVTVEGPWGDTAVIEVQAGSLEDAERQAVHLAWSRELVGGLSGYHDEDEIEVMQVVCYE